MARSHRKLFRATGTFEERKIPHTRGLSLEMLGRPLLSAYGTVARLYGCPCEVEGSGQRMDRAHGQFNTQLDYYYIYYYYYYNYYYY